MAYGTGRSAPYDHVVIFDEAQRAWDRRKTADFMKRRKRIANFNQSEPAFLISYLDRHDGWAVIVCLVGGGQEIYDGEAGIGEWLHAVRLTFGHWHVYVSPDLTGSEYAQRQPSAHLATVRKCPRPTTSPVDIDAVLPFRTCVGVREGGTRLRRR